MRFPGKATVAGLSLSLTAGTAWGAEVCARAPDLVALQVSALQQQLMVAALTCDDVALYNSFVLAYQKDLVASDQALQAFFDRFGSEEGTPAYHSFKTKMANLYSARSASDKKRYCATVRATFAPALKAEKMSLTSFAMSQPSTVSEPYTNCGETVAGGAMVTRTPVVAPTSPSNLLTAQNAAAAAKGATVAAAEIAPPLSAGLSSNPPSTSAAAAAEAKQTAQLNNSQAANSASNPQRGTTSSGRSPYYQGYGVGYARERERARQQAAAGQANEKTAAAEANTTAGDPAGNANSANSNQQRDVTRPARRSASEAYRERLAQQRAARERAAQRPSVRYRDRYEARGYYWPADPYWQYCYTRYGVKMSCAEAAQRFRNDQYYYRAPSDAGGYYPSR